MQGKVALEPRHAFHVVILGLGRGSGCSLKVQYLGEVLEVACQVTRFFPTKYSLCLFHFLCKFG
jgi:hypothetical protein